MAKRRYGEGTAPFWREDRKRWVAMFEVHDGSDRRRRKSVSALTEAECRRLLRQARSTSAALPMADERITVGAYLDRWLTDAVTPSVRPQTLNYYESMIRIHIRPELGVMKLSRLTAPDIQRYLNGKLATGLSPQSVAHQLACLRAALGQAVRWRMIGRNEATFVTPPHITRPDRTPLTIDQARTFLDHIEGSPWGAIYALALACGMRQSEILGLRWQHVDLAAGEIHVDKVLVWLKGTPFLDDPKNASSRRTVTLPEVALTALRARQAAQRLDRVGNPGWVDRDLVFTNENGDPIRRDRVTRAFQEELVAAGLPFQRFHDMRHAVVTILHGGGHGLSLQAIGASLGHSRPSETADRYAHLGGDASRIAAETMDQVIGTTHKTKRRGA